MALFKLGINIEAIVGTSLVAAVFLPFGLGLPVPIDFAVYIIKIVLLIALLALCRTIFARLRIDQLINLCWKIISPLAFLQLLINFIAKGVLGL